MYDYQFATSTGQAHRDHLLAEARIDRLAKANRSSRTTAPRPSRRTVWLRRVVAVR